ncbi:MAG: hypothetical protein CBD16_06430 [Betaproteobacteria bacterium TMED156]|nr:MAG: hypothetical protein CBD16_06430 [Betaproteobacteria bacterium TMED156]
MYSFFSFSRKVLFLLLSFIFSIFILHNNSVNAENLLKFSNSIENESYKNMQYQGNIGLALIAEESFVIPDQTITLGLRLVHDPKWHSYWLNPGDTGIPTSISWSFSHSNSSWKISDIQWPSPKRFLVGSLANFGYDEETLLIQKIHAPSNIQAGIDVTFTADVNWLVCKDVCIPGNKQLTINIPVKEKNNNRQMSGNSHYFKLARANQPVKKKYSSPINVVIDKDNQKLFFYQNSKNDGKDNQSFVPKNGFFFPFIEGLISPSSEQYFHYFGNEDNLFNDSLSGDWILEVALGKDAKDLFENLNQKEKIEGVFVDDARNGEVWAANLKSNDNIPDRGERFNFSQTNFASSQPTKPIFELLTIIIFAFLGGMILNLMPCVLPVVSLKVLSITKNANNQKVLFQQGFGFASGVVFTVMAFAFLFVTLREFGYSVGWGLQLQNPWVVLGLSILFASLALNLFGVYEIGNSLTKLGTMDNKKGIMGAFLSGVLTVIVASPCTAPFMGGAIGFAATAETYLVFIIFLSLAFGISFPYFFLISQPKLLSFIPKPGLWMIELRQFLAFPMLAASGWLIWILVELSGTSVFFPAWMCILFFCLTLWLKGRLSTITDKIFKKTFLFILSICSLILSIVFYVVSINTEKLINKPVTEISHNSLNANITKLSWIPWDEKKVKEYLEKGNVVFIDFTAIWCVTCQTNKIRVLDSERIKKFLSAPDIITMRADWTNSDEKITNALNYYGRIGVPLNVVLGPKNNDTIILSEWLTSKEVIEAIESVRN